MLLMVQDEDGDTDYDEDNDNYYEDDSCKKKACSELNDSMVLGGVEFEEFTEADTDWTSQEESAYTDEEMHMRLKYDSRILIE